VPFSAAEEVRLAQVPPVPGMPYSPRPAALPARPHAAQLWGLSYQGGHVTLLLFLLLVAKQKRTGGQTQR